MPIYVADMSWTKTPAGTLKAAGYSGVIAYCSYDRTGKNADWVDRKFVGPAYVNACLAAGLHVGLVWEGAGQEPAHLGAAGGTQHAHDFVAQARALGFTSGHLWMAGEDPTTLPASSYPAMNAYFGAARPILAAAGFTLGGYGSEAWCTQARAAKVIDRAWFVGGWARGVDADLIQQSNNPGLTTFGGAVDCNFARSPDWGYARTAASTILVAPTIAAPPNGAIDMTSLCMLTTPSLDPDHPGTIISAYAVGRDGNAYTCWQAKPGDVFGEWIRFGGEFPSK